MVLESQQIPPPPKERRRPHWPSIVYSSRALNLSGKLLLFLWGAGEFLNEAEPKWGPWRRTAVHGGDGQSIQQRKVWTALRMESQVYSENRSRRAEPCGGERAPRSQHMGAFEQQLENHDFIQQGRGTGTVFLSYLCDLIRVVL